MFIEKEELSIKGKWGWSYRTSIKVYYKPVGLYD